MNTKEDPNAKEACEEMLDELEKGVEEHLNEGTKTRIFLTLELVDELQRTRIRRDS